MQCTISGQSLENFSQTLDFKSGYQQKRMVNHQQYINIIHENPQLNPIMNRIIVNKMKPQLYRLIQSSFNPKCYPHNCGDVFFNCAGVV